MTFANFLLLMIAPASALAIGALLLFTTSKARNDSTTTPRVHPGE